MGQIVHTQGELDFAVRYGVGGRIEIFSNEAINIRDRGNLKEIASFGSSKVNISGSAQMSSYESSSIEARESALVFSSGESPLVFADEEPSTQEGQWIIATDYASIVSNGHSDIELRDRSSCFATLNERVVAMGNSSVVASGDAVVYAFDRSKVFAFDRATVHLSKNATVLSHGNDVIIIRGKEYDSPPWFRYKDLF